MTRGQTELVKSRKDVIERQVSVDSYQRSSQLIRTTVTVWEGFSDRSSAVAVA